MSDSDAAPAVDTRGSMVERLSTAVSGARWLLLGGVAAVAFVLGYIGFREHFDDLGVAKSSTDLIYLSLQLFVLESGSVPETDAPWQLEVARLAAPAATATALISAIAIVFREQIADWRLRREREHVVICGSGAGGAMLAGELIDAGRRVVGIERDGLASSVAALRRRGAAVIVGDARDRDTLRRAHLDRASHLVCLTGTDDTNADVIMHARDLVAGRTGSALVCLAHIRDPDLCVLLRSNELSSAHRQGSRLDFFNIEEQGARAMIRDHPPFPLGEAGGDPPEVLVVGLNRLGQSLVAELARQWRVHPAADGRPMTITMVDPKAAEIGHRLRRRYPLLDHAATLLAVDVDLDPLAADAIRQSRAHTAYVCIDSDSGALQAALRTRHALVDPAATVVVELVHSPGMGRLIDRPGHPDHIQAFNLLDRTMRADILLGGTHEILAQAIHAEYLQEQRRQGATAASNPSVVPWEELPASLRESNRDQAAHIGTKLAAIGGGIAPLTDWDADETTFTPAQVEALAEMEHERWVSQRRGDGWTPGPKDIDAKRTPYLVPWDSLSEEVKELDREAVRGIPAFLARAGYQIVSP